MSTEISMWVIVKLPEDMVEQPTKVQIAMEAWKAFNAALQGVEVAKADLYIGPSKTGAVKRRRAGRPRLATVPDSAA